MDHLTISSDAIVDIIDFLGTAQLRCAALHMASEALVPGHKEPISFLANDCDDIINRVKHQLSELIGKAGAA